jgi:hemolysin-activating ACP:hemolysin acyltransferase
MLSLPPGGMIGDSERQKIIGAATLMLTDDPNWHGDIKEIVNETLVPAYLHRHIRFFYSYGEVPVGFVTWAYLSPETESRVLSTLNPWLHISEWNEGPNLWIKYLYLPPGLLVSGVELCMRELFPDTKAVRCIMNRKRVHTAIEFDRDFLVRFLKNVSRGKPVRKPPPPPLVSGPPLPPKPPRND